MSYDDLIRECGADLPNEPEPNAMERALAELDEFIAGLDEFFNRD